jgi:hypothetical protein
LELLNQHLVPAAEAGEERVSYLKMHVFSFLLPRPVFLILAYTGRVIIIGTLPNLCDIRSKSRLRS